MQALELEILTTMQFDFDFDFPFPYVKDFCSGDSDNTKFEEITKVCLNSYYLHPYCLFYHPLIVAMACVVL